jgi:hypothetical protein
VSKDVRSKIAFGTLGLGQPRDKAITSLPGHVPRKLSQDGVFAVYSCRAVIDPGFMPCKHKLLGNDRFKNIILQEELVDFIQYPFPPKKITTSGLFQIDEVTDIWSQYALVFKSLMHKTLLLSGYRNHLG